MKDQSKHYTRWVGENPPIPEEVKQKAREIIAGRRANLKESLAIRMKKEHEKIVKKTPQFTYDELLGACQHVLFVLHGQKLDKRLIKREIQNYFN